MRRFIGVAFCGIALGWCGESPTQPDPRIPPATGAPTTLLMLDYHFDFENRSTTLRAEATWGGLYFVLRDVTRESQWTSGDQDILRIDGPGRAVSVDPGRTTISVTFGGRTEMQPVMVFKEEPPLPVLSGQVAGRVFDEAGNGVAGAVWAVIDGHNAGLSAMTDVVGFFRLDASWICGPTTVRASKQGYEEVVVSWMSCVERAPDLVLKQSS